MKFIPFEENDEKWGRRCLYLSENRKGKTVYCKHGAKYFPLFVKIIEDFKPDLFIELGTHMGGVTLVVHEAFPDLEIHTFDFLKLLNLDLFDLNKVSFYKENLLKGSNKILTKLLKDNKSKKKILYCDNGDKENEMDWYGDYLLSGDLIGCHDWEVEVRPEVVIPMMNEKGFTISEYSKLFEKEKLLSRFWVKN